MSGESIDGTLTARSLIISRDPESPESYISKRAVTEVLQKDAQFLKHNATIRILTQSHSEHVKGYVDLKWCLRGDERSWNCTRFLVSTTYDPPYDAVLGKADAELYGLTKRRSRQ
jgi:hypothetical protein